MSNKVKRVGKNVNKKRKTGLTFPTEMYLTTIGSFAISYWMCGQSRSKFFLEKMFKVLQKEMPEFNSYPELISKLRAAYDCPNIDLPIVAVATDSGTLLFTAFLDDTILPNREDGLPVGFMHPVRVFDLNGCEVLHYKYIKNIKGDIEEVNKEEKKDASEEG
jgi:hypothetical protein